MTAQGEWGGDLLPFDDDAAGGAQPTPEEWGEDGVLGGGGFLYDGRPMTLLEFQGYVAGYDFGPIPPTYVVLHNTGIPSATWARASSGAVWDAGEAGLSEAAILAKRKRQLDAIKTFYEKPTSKGGRGWDRGPHLFIDERRIWLFTPMREIGIHAGAGNSTRVGGRLHYSIGIEVVGDFNRVAWPEPVAALVAGAIAALRTRLSFALEHRVGPGGISGHRDYDPVRKANCPGQKVPPSFWLPRFARASGELQLAAVTPAAVAAPALPPGTFPVHPSLAAAWELSGGVWQAGRLTPGYAVRAPEELADGTIVQRFERGVARRTRDGTVSWLRLDEVAA